MRKAIVTTLMLFVALTGFCKSQRELFNSMPDSLLPVLNANLRLELVELHDMHVKADVTNRLGGVSRLDTLSADYLRLCVDSVTTVDMCMLPYNNGDSILCLVKTIGCIDGESEVAFYDQQWNALDSKAFWGGTDISELSNMLLVKPDTMSQQRFEELTNIIELKILHAEMLPLTNSMRLSMSLPMVSSEDKKHLNAILMQREFKWNGLFFKKD